MREGRILEGRQSAALTVELLDAISRTRALNAAESIRLERAIRSIAKRCETRQTMPWNREDDRRLAILIAQGKRGPQIALLMSRTHRAILRRISKLGGVEAVMAKSSIVRRAGKA